MFAVFGMHVGLSERFDRVVPQIHQRYVVAVVRLEVPIVQNQSLGAQVIIRQKLCGSCRILNYFANLATNKFRDLIIEFFVY